MTRPRKLLASLLLSLLSTAVELLQEMLLPWETYRWKQRFVWYRL
jgi:hypothetical protein